MIQTAIIKQQIFILKNCRFKYTCNDDNSIRCRKQQKLAYHIVTLNFLSHHYNVMMCWHWHLPIDFAGHRYNSAAATAQPVMAAYCYLLQQYHHHVPVEFREQVVDLVHELKQVAPFYYFLCWWNVVQQCQQA